MERIAQIAMEFMGRGGKRLRPRLCRAVFDACGGEGDVSSVCEAVECFHKASLVHDDIQDGDEERYGRPSLWKEHGVPVAIAAGDWLVARGYELVMSSGFALASRMIAAAVASHRRLCEGQGDDLLDRSASPFSDDDFDAASYVSVCERKTGEAFALAAQLGALAAGAGDAPFRRYALAYGVLFQINDDLADGADPEKLRELKEKYEHETALYRDECALGVW
jgi:geranylgeranyl pyrophosphate synthase